MVNSNEAITTNTDVSRPEGGAGMCRGMTVEPCMQHARNTCPKPHVRHGVTQSDGCRQRPGVAAVLQLRGWPVTAGWTPSVTRGRPGIVEFVVHRGQRLEELPVIRVGEQSELERAVLHVPDLAVADADLRRIERVVATPSRAGDEFTDSACAVERAVRLLVGE